MKKCPVCGKKLKPLKFGQDKKEIWCKKCNNIISTGESSEIFLNSRNLKSELANLAEHIGNSKSENVYAIFVDDVGKVKAVKLIATGKIDSLKFNPLLIFYWAIQERASVIILVHNHTTSSCRPSKDDIECVNRLRILAKLFELSLPFGVVISGKRYHIYGIEKGGK